MVEKKIIQYIVKRFSRLIIDAVLIIRYPYIFYCFFSHILLWHHGTDGLH